MLADGGIRVKTKNALHKRNWHYTPLPPLRTAVRPSESPFLARFGPLMATLGRFLEADSNFPQLWMPALRHQTEAMARPVAAMPV